MPNRYGEPPQPDDHEPDHAAAAKRGMETIRAIMGWKTPENPPETQPGTKNTAT
jgi:hypothetical protein